VAPALVPHQDSAKLDTSASRDLHPPPKLSAQRGTTALLALGLQLNVPPALSATPRDSSQ
jgi:hypothetical protein